MSAPRPVIQRHPSEEEMLLRVRVYRYFFYEWLFRDADSGTEWERSAALRHNQQQARWLPTYLFRWLVLGTIVVTLQQVCETVSGDDSPLSALLAVLAIFVVLFHLITGILWAFLQARPPR